MAIVANIGPRPTPTYLDRFFAIMTHGCGNTACTNKYCRSNLSGIHVSPNEAAANSLLFAIQNPMSICLPQTTLIRKIPSGVALEIEVPETNDDSIDHENGIAAAAVVDRMSTVVAPSTPRKRLAKAVRLDVSINHPIPASKKTLQKKKSGSHHDERVVGKTTPVTTVAEEENLWPSPCASDTRP
jgi:hypothetical protein